MVGGGTGAFIGAVHRIAARMDDKYEFIAGCLSSTPEKSIISANEINLDLNRCYPDFKTMAEEEAKREDGIEVVSIENQNRYRVILGPYDKRANVIELEKLLDENDVESITRSIDPKQSQSEPPTP